MLNDNNPAVKEMRDELLSGKTKRLTMFSFFKKKWSLTFYKGNADAIRRFDSYWRCAILVIYGIDVLLALLKLVTIKIEED